MARFKLTQPHFIEPELYKAGQVIDYSGPCTPGMEPMDKEAEKMLADYYVKHPKATLSPVDDLPRTMATAVAPEVAAAAVPKVEAPKKGA